MFAQKEQLRAFLDAINRKAQEHRENIRAEMERFRQSELQKAREDAEQQAQLLLKNENAKCKTAQYLRISLEEQRLKHSLVQKRTAIEQEAFQSAREALLRFTQLPQYEAFLRRSVEAMLQSLPQTSCVLLLRPADLPLGNALLAGLTPGSSLQTDESIQIGGCKLFAPLQKRLIDDTLDTRLAQQEEWFRGTAQLQAWIHE